MADKTEAPTEIYSIIGSLAVLALNHAGGLISDKEFSQKLDFESSNLSASS